MDPDKVTLLIRLVFTAAAIVAVVVFVLRPLWRMLRAKPDMDLHVPDFTAQLEGEELEIPADAEAGLPERRELVERARSDPRSTALLVQRWLKERR